MAIARRADPPWLQGRDEGNDLRVGEWETGRQNGAADDDAAMVD